MQLAQTARPRLVRQPDRRRRADRSIRDQDVISEVLDAALQTQYRDHAVLVTMKVLEAAGQSYTGQRADCFGRGRTTRSTLRRRASSRTCCITGSAPYAPVPITSRRHRHGMSSAMDSGVCP